MSQLATEFLCMFLHPLSDLQNRYFYFFANFFQLSSKSLSFILNLSLSLLPLLSCISLGRAPGPFILPLAYVLDVLAVNV